MTIITCPNCGTKNRVDEARADQATPKCGKCGSPLVIASGPFAITDANFSSVLVSAAAVPVLVDCWATWCPPCRAIAPLIEQLARESAGRWRIGKPDVDANPAVARQFKIDSIPTLLIFKSGQLVGAYPKPAMEGGCEKRPDSSPGLFARVTIRFHPFLPFARVLYPFQGSTTMTTQSRKSATFRVAS